MFPCTTDTRVPACSPVVCHLADKTVARGFAQGWRELAFERKIRERERRTIPRAQLHNFSSADSALGCSTTCAYYPRRSRRWNNSRSVLRALSPSTTVLSNYTKYKLDPTEYCMQVDVDE